MLSISWENKLVYLCLPHEGINKLYDFLNLKEISKNMDIYALNICPLKKKNPLHVQEKQNCDANADF